MRRLKRNSKKRGESHGAGNGFDESGQEQDKDGRDLRGRAVERHDSDEELDKQRGRSPGPSTTSTERLAGAQSSLPGGWAKGRPSSRRSLSRRSLGSGHHTSGSDVSPTRSVASLASKASAADFDDLYDVDRDERTVDAELNPDVEHQIDADEEDFDQFNLPRPGTTEVLGRGMGRGNKSRVSASRRLSKLVGSRLTGGKNKDKKKKERGAGRSLSPRRGKGKGKPSARAADDDADEEEVVRESASAKDQRKQEREYEKQLRLKEKERKKATLQQKMLRTSKRLSKRLSSGHGGAETEKHRRREAAKQAKLRAKQEAKEEERRQREIKSNPWYPAGVDFRYLSPKSKWLPFLGRKSGSPSGNLDFGDESRLVGVVV